MPEAYDAYRAQSSLDWNADGKTVNRVLYVRADNEILALYVAGNPARGDPLDVGEGSLSEIIYCSNVNVNQVREAAGDENEEFLWEVSADYGPLSGSGGTTPVVNKAAWRIDFRPEKIKIMNVEEEADQTNFGPEGSAAEEFPIITTGINVTEAGAQGTEIDNMVEVLVIDFWVDPDDLEEYLEGVRSIVNRTNEEAFEGPWGSYPEGEAKITGLSVAKSNDDITTVSVEISRGENLTDAGSGGNVLNIFLDSLGATVEVAKKAWQYLWVRYIKSADPDDETDVRPRSIDVHVATVYREGDFTLLGVTEGIFV